MHNSGSKKKTKRPSRDRGALWNVRNPKKLRELVQRRIDERCGGSQRRAAKEFDLSQAWLNRFLAGKRQITQAQFGILYGLMTLLGDENYFEWRESIMPPGTQETIGHGGSVWEQEVLANSSRGSGTRWVRSRNEFIAVPIEKDSNGLTARDRERNLLWAHVKDRWPKLVKRFARIFEADRTRQDELALRRVLDPLIDDSESGYNMLSWRELHPKRLEAVIRLGIIREAKLLVPLSHPVARMVRAGDMSLDSFVRDHGPESVFVFPPDKPVTLRGAH